MNRDKRPVIRLQWSGWWARTRHKMFGHAPPSRFPAPSMVKFADSDFVYIGPFATVTDAYNEVR